MILYTDIDSYCCRWIVNLIENGSLPYGHVLQSDLNEIEPKLLTHYTSVHFCCGLGGWPLALHLSGWPTDLPVWTASLPCQPFSAAGKQLGTSDKRNLWLKLSELIHYVNPPVLFGEQVASKLAREWFSVVRSHLDLLGYAVGAAVISSASVALPTYRPRLYFVAESPSVGPQEFSPNDTEALERTTWLARAALPESVRYSIQFRCDDPTDALPLLPADGVSRPVGAISALGNAIVPDLAAAFITSYRQTLTERILSK